jgi:hypothetical protein
MTRIPMCLLLFAAVAACGGSPQTPPPEAAPTPSAAPAPTADGEGHGLGLELGGILRMADETGRTFSARISLDRHLTPDRIEGRFDFANVASGDLRYLGRNVERFGFDLIYRSNDGEWPEGTRIELATVPDSTTGEILVGVVFPTGAAGAGGFLRPVQ